ncbi:MAG: ABC transporter permease, partial [Actinobacteria bacterium]|nr:ABC transporter permease [Actinomycetota bacterium]
ALMVGLALVTFVAVLGQGIRSSVVGRIDEQVAAEYVVGSQTGFGPVPAAAGDAVVKASVVEVASNVRGDSARVGGAERTVTGIDVATVVKVYRFDWKDGSDAVLGQLHSSQAIVTETLAQSRSLKVGSRLPVVTPDNKQVIFEVRGIYKPPALGSLLGDVTISKETFDATFPRLLNLYTFINVKGEPTDSSTKALEQQLAAFPDVKLQTHSEFVDSQTRTVDLLLNLLYVLLALSVIVSLFGMINTLALSVVERTRELGMLRAVGMTRRQLRRMVRHESIITAQIGAALGLPLGIFLAALVTAALADQGIGFAVPGGPLVVFSAVAMVAGLIAAIPPARRASRLNVLEALKFE